MIKTVDPDTHLRKSRLVRAADSGYQNLPNIAPWLSKFIRNGFAASPQSAGMTQPISQPGRSQWYLYRLPCLDDHNALGRPGEPGHLRCRRLDVEACVLINFIKEAVVAEVDLNQQHAMVLLPHIELASVGDEMVHQPRAQPGGASVASPILCWNYRISWQINLATNADANDYLFLTSYFSPVSTPFPK